MIRRIARTAAIYPPNTDRRFVIRIGRLPIIGYCKAYQGADRSDPGNTLMIGPVKPYSST